MKIYEVTIIGEISVEVEADNEIEAELKALDEFHFTFDSCRVAGVDCLDDED